MRKVFVLLIISLCVSSTTFSQENNDATDAKEQAVITFEKTIHDFGLLPYKGDGKCEFAFKNTGKAPLILTNVKSSCGCTIPTWPREPIAKKKDAVIKVKYDTKRQGKFTKTITVFSNASNTPVRLTIRGEVTKPTAKEMETLRIEREKRAAKNRERYNKKKAATQQKSVMEKGKALPEKK